MFKGYSMAFYTDIAVLYSQNTVLPQIFYIDTAAAY
jgi:hypothetical protein